MNVFLDGEKYLIGVYGLDEVVGNLRAHRLIHNVLLLALGHHNHGRKGTHLLDKRKCFKARHTRHHLVEDDEIVVGAACHLDSVEAVVAALHLVAFTF